MKSIYFIRHGEAEHNIGYLKKGEEAYFSNEFINSSLTENGKNQCNIVKNNNLQVDVVFTSSLKRTLQTTDIIFTHKNIPIIVLDELRECNYNHPCNRREERSKIEKEFPNFITENITEKDEWFIKGDPYNRFDKLTEYLKNTSYTKIGVVSHESYLKEYLLTIGYKKNTKIKNCDVICMEI